MPDPRTATAKPEPIAHERRTSSRIEHLARLDAAPELVESGSPRGGDMRSERNSTKARQPAQAPTRSDERSEPKGIATGRAEAGSPERQAGASAEGSPTSRNRTTSSKRGDSTPGGDSQYDVVDAEASRRGSP